MVETAQHCVRAHGNILTQAMSGYGIDAVMRCRRRIGDTWTQGHMRARPIVVDSLLSQMLFLAYRKLNAASGESKLSSGATISS
jgi:hypothetical protein